MLYIQKIDDYLEILTEEEVNHFRSVNFSEYFKSTRPKLYFKLNEERNIRKVAESFDIFLKAHDQIEKSVKIMQIKFF